MSAAIFNLILFCGVSIFSALGNSLNPRISPQLPRPWGDSFSTTCATETRQTPQIPHDGSATYERNPWAINLLCPPLCGFWGEDARLYLLLLLIISFPSHWDMWGKLGKM